MIYHHQSNLWGPPVHRQPHQRAQLVQFLNPLQELLIIPSGWTYEHAHWCRCPQALQSFQLCRCNTEDFPVLLKATYFESTMTVWINILQYRDTLFLISWCYFSRYHIYNKNLFPGWVSRANRLNVFLWLLGFVPVLAIVVIYKCTPCKCCQCQGLCMQPAYRNGKLSAAFHSKFEA